MIKESQKGLNHDGTRQHTINYATSIQGRNQKYFAEGEGGEEVGDMVGVAKFKKYKGNKCKKFGGAPPPLNYVLPLHGSKC